MKDLALFTMTPHSFQAPHAILWLHNFFPIFHKNFQVKDRTEIFNVYTKKKEKKLTHSSCFLFFCPYINKNKTLEKLWEEKIKNTEIE